MSYSPVFPFINSLLSFYFVRTFVHLFVLASLLAHQFLFKAFIDPYLSVFVYSLCFFILTVDSLFLFFYKEDQKSFPLDIFLLFLDALFLSALVVILGPFGLLFVFILFFFQSFSLFLSKKVFQPFVFFIYLSMLLPIAFLWGGNFSFEERLSLVSFINIAFFFIFFFSWLYTYILSFLEDRKDLLPDTSLVSVKPDSNIGLSLDLARKLKPGLNSLIKYFPENQIGKETTHSVSQSFFPPKKGRYQLEQMRNFILDFIEYAEPEIEFLFEEFVDLKDILKKLLHRLKNHPQRPENLTQKLELPADFKIQGSADHLNKCFKHILVNSFEALKNQEKPEIHIQGYLEKSWLSLEFLDNGPWYQIG